MKTKGKFFLQLNQASACPYFWNMEVQNFTSDASKATFFNTMDEANRELSHAVYQTESEVFIAQATKDLT